MPYRSYEIDMPDPGTVDTDDRCAVCGAGEGAPCDPLCVCQACLRRRAQASHPLVAVKVARHVSKRGAA